MHFLNIFILFILALSSFELHANARQFKFDPLGNLLIIGDMHADPHAFLNILLYNDMINDKGEWIAKDTDIVFMGDMIDRGPDSLTTLDLLIHYKKLAADNGCRIHTLIGNHDLMPFEGDFSYMHPIDRIAFAKLGMDSEAEILYLLTDPKMPYAQELQERQAFIKIGELGFVHAGLDQFVFDYTPDQVNTLFREYVEKLLTKSRDGQAVKPTPKALFGQLGPLWGRSLVEEGINEATFEKMLAAWDMKALAVGHTTTELMRPEFRFGNRLIMTDTGISVGMEGQVWSVSTTKEKLKNLDFEVTRLARRSERVTKLLRSFTEQRNVDLLVKRLNGCR